mmetsp:Transcript_23830/g.32644  ORF Transcript_23830/g.32644 Transcript_23830/m.32644 type:complete len:411 (-) Transcript_23830:1583-2815(-)
MSDNIDQTQLHSLLKYRGAATEDKLFQLSSSVDRQSQKEFIEIPRNKKALAEDDASCMRSQLPPIATFTTREEKLSNDDPFQKQVSRDWEETLKDISNPSQAYNFPQRPQMLMRSHFEVESAAFHGNAYELVVFIQIKLLPEFEAIAFADFNAEVGVWHGKHIRGAVCCYFDIFVYSDRRSDKFIIEGVKTKGDPKPFVYFFKDFKRKFIPSIETAKPQILCNFGSLSCSPITDDEYYQGLQPIFRMAQATNYEARLEAAKMLCDLFQQNQSQLQLPEVMQACVQSLEGLVQDNFPDIKQHAIMAMSILSDLQCYKSDLITSSSLAVVVSLVTENPEPNLSYETIQIRRECAKILITLAQFNAAGVVESINRLRGATFLPHWFSAVQQLEDVRLRSHSEKALNILTRISS